MFANFQEKQTTLTFLAQICPKMNFGAGISKSKSGLGINISKTPCVQVQNVQL